MNVSRGYIIIVITKIINTQYGTTIIASNFRAEVKVAAERSAAIGGISEYEMIGNHAFFYRWVVRERPQEEQGDGEDGEDGEDGYVPEEGSDGGDEGASEDVSEEQDGGSEEEYVPESEGEDG